MCLVCLLTVTAVPQVPFDCLAGKRIQFAIQITIHQFSRFFAVHLISPYRCEPPKIPSAWPARGRAATSPSPEESVRCRQSPCKIALPGAAASGSHEIRPAIHPSLPSLALRPHSALELLPD